LVGAAWSCRQKHPRASGFTRCVALRAPNSPVLGMCRRAPACRPRGDCVMDSYRLDHLADSTLLRHPPPVVAKDRSTPAYLVAHLAELDARRLHLQEGYSSALAYCVGRLRLSEQSALKRIRAGRTARNFPAIFPALADGRLHLSGVILLKP